MHKVSRTLLLAGVLAFGTLTAACGDKVTVAGNNTAPGVTQIQVTPPSATIAAGTSIQLAVSVTADAATAKTVTYTSSNSAVATVDATGKVTGVAAGTATITATSTADASKAAAAFITVTGTTTTNNAGSIDISTVTDLGGNPVNLSNVFGQVNVTVNTSGGGLIEVFLSQNCTTNTIASTDVAVATQQATSAQAGQVTLSFNTAQLTAANQARFANGNYCVKTRLTNGTSVVVATNTVPLTLNNVNVFRSTLTFASQTGGPTQAVSTNNGLSYNQGTLTVTINPVIFTSASQVNLISGYLSLNGEQAGVPISTTIPFTNAAVTNGVATIVFTDTSATGVRSIFQYTTSANAAAGVLGDQLVITAATDAAGNAIQSTSTISANNIRIDNDIPLNAGSVYTVTAPNGYLGAAYLFSSGTSGTAAADTRGGIPGVGGVTTTYYVGAAGSTAFATANSCDVTALTAASGAAALANTTSTDVYQAKVVVQDALGNKVCRDVASTFTGGLFGVDKIAPSIAIGTGDTTQTAGTLAANGFGYRVSKIYSFTFADTISGFNPALPLQLSLVRNFGTSATAADCVIGTYTASSNTCAKVSSSNPIEFTGATGVVGYYTVTANSIDRALNTSATLTRIAAYDPIFPVLGAVSATTATPLGSTTVTGAASDNFDLASASGRLTYATLQTLTVPVPGFAQVAGTNFGTTFDATLVTSGTASVTLTNVYRGLQTTTVGSNVIVANAATPVAQLSVIDAARNDVIGSTAVATTTASANILAGNTFYIFPGSGAGSAYSPAANLASTTITAQVVGSSTDPVFQNQPFAQIDLYRTNVRGELVLVGTSTLASVTDTAAGVRTYTYTLSGVALNAAANNVFYAVGRNAAGDAVITQSATVVNP